MTDLERPNFDTHGYFEGTYDFHPGTHSTVQGDVLQVYMPRIDRWALSIAAPELYGFSGEIDKCLPKIHFPYRPTNALKQIGLQFWHNQGGKSEVPDAYSVLYARSGSTRNHDHDVTKELRVDILRDDLAVQLAYDDRPEMTLQRWHRVAQVGQRFGNAILAFSTKTQSYRPAFSLQGSKSKNISELGPVASEALAQAVFDTVYFWGA